MQYHFLHDPEAKLATSSTCDLELHLPTGHGEDYTSFEEAFTMFLIKDNDGVLEACNSFKLLATAEEDHSTATKHFKGTSGSSDIAKHQQSPLDFLLLLLGAEMFHLIAEETNRYTQFKGAIN